MWEYELEGRKLAYRCQRVGCYKNCNIRKFQVFFPSFCLNSCRIMPGPQPPRSVQRHIRCTTTTSDPLRFELHPLFERYPLKYRQFGPRVGSTQRPTTTMTQARDVPNTREYQRGEFRMAYSTRTIHVHACVFRCRHYLAISSIRRWVYLINTLHGRNACGGHWKI